MVRQPRYRLDRYRSVALFFAALVNVYEGVGTASANDAASTSTTGQRIETLIEEMTLEEKLGQLTQQWGGEIQDVNPVTTKTKLEDTLAAVRSGGVGSFLGAHGAVYTNLLQRTAVNESRLKIPLIIGNDVIHGYKTIFPIPLAEAASWNPGLIERAAAVAAAEARASGTHWTFAPMVDITVDPRWGRVAEGSGEDPTLGSILAAARVRGYQGEDPSAPDRLLACAKHFVAYGGAEGGRDYNTVDISEQTLREIYLPPFKAAVDAGVASLMSAFNEINGVPTSANKLTLTTILRHEWGFDGFVVSDWNSVGELVQHGYAVDGQDAAEKAISAGVDMDMSSWTFRTHLKKSVEAGRISENVIDTAVRRVLGAKFAAGLFERPYTDESLESKVWLSADNREVAREMARHSIVLLKNENALLPIKPSVKRLAVIGPMADNNKDPFGTWAGIGDMGETVTVLDGIRQRAGSGVEILYARGCDAEGGDRAGFDEARTIAEKADFVLLVVGEGKELSGEAHCRTNLQLPGMQQALVEAIHATGKPVAVVLMAGRPLAITWIAEHVPAIVETWHLGTECGHAIADVLFGDFNPCGKLPITFPRNVGQVPIYYYHKNTGRPPTDDRYTSKYIDTPSTPLYPFGYGLSYTSFGYANLNVTPDKMGRSGTLTVSADVTNNGKRAGREIVQLYVRDLVASITPPVKRLRGFEHVDLQPGETKTVRFTLSGDDLRFYNAHLEFVVEPGDFSVWIGPDSANGLEGKFAVTGG